MLVAACALASCDAEALDPAPIPAKAAADPRVPGPYAVGVTSIVAASEGDRELPVEIWYPAEPTDAAPTDYPVGLDTFTLARIPSGLGAVRDAPLSREGAPHAVVVFSHGHRSFRAQSVYLMEHLASHGFVVAAPDHVGGTLLGSSVLPPGLVARYRPSDVSASLDALLAASSAPGLLHGAADGERVGVAGHSYGGFSALRIVGATIDAAAVEAACGDELLCEGWDPSLPASQRDERFSAAVLQSPAAAFTFDPKPEHLRTVEVPVLVMGGSHDEITPYDRECAPTFAALTGATPRWLALVDGAGHFTFSNVCALLDGLGLELEALEDGCGPEDIAPEDAQRIAASHATAFFQEALRGDPPSGLLDEDAPRDPLVTSFERVP